MSKTSLLPAHIGIIMDGNGRWAAKRLLPRTEGHRQGAKTLETVVAYAKKIGIRYLTFYAFSTENWKRPKNEVDTLIRLLHSYVDRLLQVNKDDPTYRDVRICFLGDLSVYDRDLQGKMDRLMEVSASEHPKMTVNIAINYGGRAEICHAVNRLIAEGHTRITETLLSDRLYTSGQPDPDLIIRASGEMRLSNFMLWQAAYAEFYTTPIFWPDFSEKDLDDAIAAYLTRTRRMGGL